MGASDAGTETPENSSFSEGLKRYSRTSRWTQLSQYMAWLLITINRHLQRTHCFQLWEPTIDMAHVKDVPIYITKKASADRFSIFYRAEGPDQASRRDAQPAPKWSCSAGDWGAASTSKKDIRSHGRMSFFRKCIDTCPACYICAEFGTIVVIPRKILYRVSGGKADRTRTAVPKTRYNE